jgi:hypothetical protein
VGSPAKKMLPAARAATSTCRIAGAGSASTTAAYIVDGAAGRCAGASLLWRAISGVKSSRRSATLNEKALGPLLSWLRSSFIAGTNARNSSTACASVQ